MTVFLIVSIVVLLGLAVAAVLGRFGHTDLQMSPPTSTAGGWGVDDAGPIDAQDLGDIRFDTAVRGYRMDQVDAVLARLRTELQRRDSETFGAVERPRTAAVPPTSSPMGDDAGVEAEGESRLYPFRTRPPERES